MAIEDERDFGVRPVDLHRPAIEYDPEPPYDAGAPEKASATAIALVREGVAAREARAAVRS